MVKRLVVSYLNNFGSRKKFRFVLKRFWSDLVKFVVINKWESNRCEYGAETYNTLLSYFVSRNGNALKKLAGIFLLYSQNNRRNKPCFQLRFSFSSSLVIGNLRKAGKSLLLKWSQSALLGCFFSSSRGSQRFSSNIVELDSNLNRLIVEKLNQGVWPSDDLYIRNNLDIFIRSVQSGILTREAEQQLDYIEPFIFDIKNRIHAIDTIFKSGKSISYSQAGYSDLVDKVHKFTLLTDSKYSNLSKLPVCKIVKVDIPKINNNRVRSLRVSMPVDQVLQQMFLTFLDVVVEGVLKPSVFAYRKGRDGRMAVAAAYSNLNRLKYINDFCVCSVNLEHCFSGILHGVILSIFPFPVRYKSLLVRWLQANLIDKNNNFRNLGRNRRGVPQGSILGPVIVNYMLSYSFPNDVKSKVGNGKSKKWVWVNLFNYAGNLLMISNNKPRFVTFMSQLKANLSFIGLCFNNDKIKYIVNIKKKVYFTF